MATPKTTRRPATRAEARALAHPLRLRILRLCLDEALTNRDIAARLDRRPATVFYHVRTLERTGFLRREEDRRGRRGAREIPYRSTRKSWALSFEPDAAGHLAMMDATRSELIEAGPEAVLTLTRMAVRLDGASLARLERLAVELVNEAEASDGSGPDPVGLFVAIHRRR